MDLEIYKTLTELKDKYQKLNKKALEEGKIGYANLYHGSQAAIDEAIRSIQKIPSWQSQASLTIDELINLTDGRDDKVYFFFTIRHLDGTSEDWKGRIACFPYTDWDKFLITRIDFSGHRGEDENGDDLPSVIDWIELKELE